MTGPATDRRIIAALSAGLKPRDIFVMRCRCGAYSYYGRNHHFACHVCGWQTGIDYIEEADDHGQIVTLEYYNAHEAELMKRASPEHRFSDFR